MSRKLWLVPVGVILVGSAMFAATVLGDEDPKAVPGGVVHKTVERVKSSSATASAEAVASKARPLKKVGVFAAAQPTIVPANGATAPSVLTCPSRGLIVAGGWETDRIVAADISRPDGKRAWRFGFFDMAGAQGQATEWIVCVK
jgi:hypothetical protein